VAPCLAKFAFMTQLRFGNHLFCGWFFMRLCGGATLSAWCLEYDVWP